MKIIIRLVVWTCSKFKTETIISLVIELLKISDKYEIRVKKLAKAHSKNTHSNYKDFIVDPLPPLTYSEMIHKKRIIYYEKLLSEIKAKKKKAIN